MRTQNVSSSGGSVSMMPVRLFTTNTNQSETVQKMRRRSSVAPLSKAPPRLTQVDGEQQDEAPEKKRAPACPEIEELIVGILRDRSARHC